jgi:hypothetical protein
VNLQDQTFVSLLEDVRYGRDVANALDKLYAMCKRPLAITVRVARLFTTFE